MNKRFDGADLRRIPFRPAEPQSYRPGLGLIGCGGIAKWHLRAYRDARLSVVCLCDLDVNRADSLRREFYPDADVVRSPSELLERTDLEVVDVATHPVDRGPLIESALRAGKHVLSQKPFVLDLDEGRRLCDLADRQSVRLAVNQNARWAPHFAFAREAVRAGAVGEALGAHLAVHWSHAWVKGTPFESVRHLLLYDYAIHWFDMLNCLLPTAPRRVFASTARTPTQEIDSPLLAQALIEFESAQATLAFDADTPHGQQANTFIAGTRGSIRSTGPDNNRQTASVTTADGEFSPALSGSWFPDGFRGAMCELLCAIEEDRTPSIDARRNLASLATCFAAVESAETGKPIDVGSVTRLPA